jgi:hypothetical protein
MGYFAIPPCLYQDMPSFAALRRTGRIPRMARMGLLFRLEQQPFLCTPFNPWKSVIQTENDQDMAVHPPDERPHPGHPGYPACPPKRSEGGCILVQALHKK